MAMCDKFIILANVQFEKNNYQNRYLLNDKDKWVTKSVNNGIETIKEKKYTDGNNLLTLNMYWINAIRHTLNIKTQIEFDYPTELKGTERLSNLVLGHGGDTYVTNPSAKDKYLDESSMKEQGIKIEYCVVPKHLQKHIFEIFEEYGIDGTIKQLPKR